MKTVCERIQVLRPDHMHFYDIVCFKMHQHKSNFLKWMHKGHLNIGSILTFLAQFAILLTLLGMQECLAFNLFALKRQDIWVPQELQLFKSYETESPLQRHAQYIHQMLKSWIYFLRSTRYTILRSYGVDTTMIHISNNQYGCFPVGKIRPGTVGVMNMLAYCVMSFNIKPGETSQLFVPFFWQHRDSTPLSTYTILSPSYIPAESPPRRILVDSTSGKICPETAIVVDKKVMTTFGVWNHIYGIMSAQSTIPFAVTKYCYVEAGQTCLKSFKRVLQIQFNEQGDRIELPFVPQPEFSIPRCLREALGEIYPDTHGDDKGCLTKMEKFIDKSSIPSYLCPCCSHQVDQKKGDYKLAVLWVPEKTRVDNITPEILRLINHVEFLEEVIDSINVEESRVEAPSNVDEAVLVVEENEEEEGVTVEDVFLLVEEQRRKVRELQTMIEKEVEPSSTSPQGSTSNLLAEMGCNSRRYKRFQRAILRSKIQAMETRAEARANGTYVKAAAEPSDNPPNTHPRPPRRITATTRGSHTVLHAPGVRSFTLVRRHGGRAKDLGGSKGWCGAVARKGVKGFEGWMEEVLAGGGGGETANRARSDAIGCLQ